MLRIGSLGAALAIAITSAAIAAPVDTWEAYRPKTAEDAAADKITAAENLKWIEASRAVDARNAAARKAYEEALAVHAAEVDAQRAAAEAGEVAYAKAMAEWEARVAACRGGDYSQCQQP